MQSAILAVSGVTNVTTDVTNVTTDVTTDVNNASTDVSNVLHRRTIKLVV